MKFVRINNEKCVISKISNYLAFTLDGEVFYTKKWAGKKLKEWTLLKKMKSGSAGYYCVTTPLGKKYVHRIVCETFHKKIRSKNYVNHKDLNVYNNKPSNLEWCNSSENVKHALAKISPKKIFINGVQYSHYSDAVKDLKINKDTIRRRCLSNNFKNYKLVVWKKK